MLRERGCRVEVLDGDVVRTTFRRVSSFSREDRDTNILRIGFVANLLARNGVAVITAAISPYRDTRDANVRVIEADGAAFIEVHVAATLEECEARDVKGLYAEARAGKRPGFTGIDDPYSLRCARNVIAHRQRVRGGISVVPRGGAISKRRDWSPCVDAVPVAGGR